MKRLISFLLALALLLPLCVFAEEEPEPTPEPSELDQAVDSKFRYRRFGVELGEWDLDANIGVYLGGSSPFFAASPRYKTVGITSRMLMSHTSSIWFDKFNPKPPMLKALNVKTSHREYFYQDKPGTRMHYSNYGAGILGVIIELLTNRRLDDAVAELIFDPMGLDAGYSPEYLRNPTGITSEVIREYGEGIDPDIDYALSYGNCWMTCSDLCRIGIMLCDYGMFNGQRILQEETVREMMSSQKGKGGITVDSLYGLNVQRQKMPSLLPDRLFYGHQGMSDNVLCALFYEPETRFVFAMVSVCMNPGENQGKQDGLRNLAYDLMKVTWKEFGGR